MNILRRLTLVSATAGAAMVVSGSGGAAPGDLTPVAGPALGLSGDGTKVLVLNQASLPFELSEYDVATGQSTLVSSSDLGVPGNGDSTTSSMSEDGTKIAFISQATNLDAADTDSVPDVYVKDLTTGDVSLVSTSSSGQKAVNTLQTNSGQIATAVAISGDGSTVAWISTATNLGAPPHCTTIHLDPPGHPGTGPLFTYCDSHLFVKRLATGTVTVADTAENNDLGNATVGSGVSISGNGDRVAFTSAATNLGSGASGAFVKDITSGSLFPLSPYGGTPSLSRDGTKVGYFCIPPGAVLNIHACVRDLATGTETLASPGQDPVNVDELLLSGDGSHLAFNTEDAILPSDNDDPTLEDVYVTDLATGQYELASTDSSGQKLTVDSGAGGFSTDAKRVLIVTGATAYVKELGGAPPVLDANGDGVVDSLQPAGTATGAFVDSSLTPPTTGSIVDAGGLTVTIGDASSSADGVRIQVGPGSGSAKLSVCGGFTLKVSAGSTVIVTCGSVRLKVESGQAQIVLGDGSIVVTFAAGVEGKVSQSGAAFTVLDLGGGPLTVTTNGVDQIVPLGGSTILDTTAPTVTPLVTGTLGTNGWYRSNVSVSWTIADPETAVSGTGCDPVTVSADTSTVTLTCKATSGGGTTTRAVTVKRDASAPTVGFAGHPAAYTIDQNVTIACTASDALSGIATGCQGINAPAYTFAIGSNSRSTSATDNAGNTGTASTSFTVSVTASSLCQLTRQFIQASSKYAHLTAAQRSVIDAAANVICQSLNSITSKLTSKQKATLVAAYKSAVAALVGPGWLTQAQAATLTSLADHV